MELTIEDFEEATDEDYKDLKKDLAKVLKEKQKGKKLDNEKQQKLNTIAIKDKENQKKILTQ